jgi:carboxymethylenebutenolidase
MSASASVGSLAPDGAEQFNAAVPTFTPAQQALIRAWEAHTAAEFELHDADAALAVMTDDPELLHVPIGVGARGRDALRAVYADVFIPNVPPDAGLELLTGSVTDDRLIDEFVFHFTHTVQIDWLAPGIAPTGRAVALPHVAVIAFDRDKIATEHIYWDQASALVQLGVLDEHAYPVLGSSQAVPFRHVTPPTNELITQWRTP